MQSSGLLELGQYIIIRILLQSEIVDVLNIRQVCCIFQAIVARILIAQTCSVLHQVSQAKVVWLNFLNLKNIGVAPPYTKVYSEMSGHEVEILTRRSARMEYTWSHGQLGLKHITRLDLPQEVKWLRLLGGRWLLVASADDYVSRLCCFDISLFSESTKAIAECFFAGAVKTGCAELQSDGLVVIALGIAFP